MKSIVSIVRCGEYSQEIITNKIIESLTNIGGIDQFINSHTRVHIKPNLLSAKEPHKAVTTHPTIVKAVVEIIKKKGAQVFIGDSPAGISRPIEEYWKITGISEIADQTGANLIALEKKGVAERIINKKSYFIAKPISDADVIINICKMKTHGLTLFTGAIKNMFGIIPGVRKGEFHKFAPKVKDFSNILVDIFEAAKPHINIMDAVEAMEGNGPSSGNPFKVGLILASTDAVALDAVASYIMGFVPNEILTTQIANNRKLGQIKFDQIEFHGVDKGEIIPLNIKLPSNRLYQPLPEFMLKFLGNLIWLRPRVKPEVCKRCGICIQNCPVQAMSSRNGLPQIDDKICIKCFCCDEICPHNAITQQMSWIAKKLS